MADELRVHHRPELTEPVLIGAFRGWNDGAQAASLAAGYLAKTWSAERFADVDPEHFFDFQATRPHVSLEEGLTRRIDWPETAFYHARPDGLDRDVVLLLGIEPNLRWRTFSELLIGLAEELATRGQPGSSACSTTRASAWGFRPRASGPPCRTTSR